MFMGFGPGPCLMYPSDKVQGHCLSEYTPTKMLTTFP